MKPAVSLLFWFFSLWLILILSLYFVCFFTMVCPLFIYSTLEFWNLWIIVFHQFWKILFKYNAPFSLLFFWISSYTDAKPSALSSTFLNFSNLFSVLDLCATCWIISSELLSFKIFSLLYVHFSKFNYVLLKICYVTFYNFLFLEGISKLVLSLSLYI